MLMSKSKRYSADILSLRKFILVRVASLMSVNEKDFIAASSNCIWHVMHARQTLGDGEPSVSGDWCF